MPINASGEKERETDLSYVESKVRFNEGLKAESSSHPHTTSKDLQVLKNTAFTLTNQVLASFFEEDQEIEIDIQRLNGAAEKLDEVLKVDAHDHETLLTLGRVHYQIATFMELLPLADFQRDVYTEHCRKARECYLVLQREAPGLYDMVPSILQYTRDMLNNLGLYSETCDEELSDTSDSVFMSDRCCNMGEDMIQDAVERLLEAMSILSDDNNRNVVDKLATHIYFNPCTGNNQVDECREGLLVSAKDAKEALAQHPRDARKLKEGALALILLRERPTKEVEDTNVTETRLYDAITMLEEVLMIHPNDCEATLYLGKGHYYLWLDNTLHLDSAVRETYRQKAIEYFSAVRDKAVAPVMVNEAEDLLDTLYEKHTEDNHNRATDENVMLMKFVGVLFEAMLLGTDQRCKVAGEKSVKDHLLVQELTSLRRQVDTMMMKLSESP